VAVLGSIPAQQGSGSRVEASGCFLAANQSCCRSWPELGCTGAAGPRRSRSGSILSFGAWRRLGFGWRRG
jgi:hypothetical protein